jgi:broad specificity phosphatase PhoE
MTQIIVARHGETEWNASEIFRGRRDIGLNDTGIKQAELLGNYLTDLRIEAIYSSPLKRALDTARSVAKHHSLNVNVNPGLLDFNYGAWEGLTHQAVKDKYRELYTRWLKEPHLVNIPEGENLSEVRERAKSLLDRVVSKHSGLVVLVSHRVVNKVMMCFMLGLENSHFWDIKQDLGGITVFEHERGRYKLIKHNDTSYLNQIQKHTLDDF